MHPRGLHFSPFRLDLVNEQLWRDTERLPLRPKTFAVLRHLAERAGELVTRDELVAAVWGGAAGSEQLPKGCVRELRGALEDDAETPRFIETVGRRGYRFVAPVSLGRLERDPRAAGRAIVGRERDLGELGRWLDAACGGTRRLGFVTGEPGVGKTTLVDAFLERIPSASALWTGRGQCSEHFGACEAYLPVLEALGRLCRQDDGERLLALLAHHAPTWLLQMPALLDDAALERVQRRAQGATRERMLRELAEAFEVLTAERPLVLVLEDLQWSDPSTLDLLAYLARRREPARLLVIGTYRPADVIVSGHPLRAVQQELRASGQAEELALGFLDRADVVDYLAARFPSNAFGSDLATSLYRTTDGNPLFVVSVVDYLVARGAIVERAGRWCADARAGSVAAEVPESLRGLIDREVERLGDADQRLLEAASVAGVEFSAGAVAAGLREQPAAVEERLAALARREVFIRAQATDAGYQFLHALHHRVLYERLGDGPRMRLHGDVGEWLEQSRSVRAGEIAALLAEHFARGGRATAAVYYRLTAAQNALGRHAHREAVAQLEDALDLLEKRPDGSERSGQQLGALVALGASLMAIQGHAIREAERIYAHARELCWELGDGQQLPPVLRGLQRVRLVRGELEEARMLGEGYLAVAGRPGNEAALPDAHLAVGETLVFGGSLADGLAHLRRGIDLHTPRPSASSDVMVLQDPGIGCRFYAALAHWLTGNMDQALGYADETRRAAEALGHPYTRAYAASRTALIHHVRRDVDATRAAAEVALDLGTAHGFELVRAQATLLRGWALAMQGETGEGLALMTEGQAAWEKTGALILRPFHLALLSEGLAHVSRVEEALALLTDARATAERTGERWWEAELYRLTGELSLRGGRLPSEAERWFREAVELARRQGARSLELRASVSLCRLSRSREPSRWAEALTATYAQFTEGFASADLREARAQLGR